MVGFDLRSGTWDLPFSRPLSTRPCACSTALCPLDLVCFLFTVFCLLLIREADSAPEVLGWALPRKLLRRVASFYK